MNLSDRIRDDSIAQPWVVEEVEKLEERIRKMERAGDLMSEILRWNPIPNIGRLMWLEIERPKRSRIET